MLTPATMKQNAEKGIICMIICSMYNNLKQNVWRQRRLVKKKMIGSVPYGRDPKGPAPCRSLIGVINGSLSATMNLRYESFSIDLKKLNIHRFNKYKNLIYDG
jgi:hypothetical protein